jgi:peptide/nickel transport system ATP-binding protein
MVDTFLAGFTQKEIQTVSEDEILKVENLTKYYISGYVITNKVLGAEDVSFSLKKGEVLSLVGESGSGKSTVANMILRLFKPTKGKILLEGKDAFSFKKKDYWRRVQAIFQDPYSTFNHYYVVDKPLMDSFGLIENSGKTYSKTERKEIIGKTLETIGMNPDEILGRYPHQTSGGEMQRLLIARTLIIGPEVLVADEPTSMTDASTRVAILNELLRLKETRNMAVLFITHDVGQAYYVSDRAAVMKDGRIVEIGSAEKVFFDPEHPYTKNLIASVPKVHEKWEI